MNVKTRTSGSGESFNGAEMVLEMLAGRIVLDLIRESLPLNRKTLSGRVAVMLARDSISAEERTGLEIFLRLLLEN